MKIKLLIADDHSLIRKGLKNVLELEEDFEVIGEAKDGEEALDLTKELKPDILILDINMPKINGIEVCRGVVDLGLNTRCVMLTIHDDKNYVIEVMKAGASGYLLKDIETPMLMEALKIVHKGTTYIHPALVPKLINLPVKGVENRSTFKQRSKRLTGRELEVLQMLAKGMSNQELASKLFVSEKTIKNHLTSIFKKIEVADRTQAVLYAVKNKIVVLGNE